MEMSYGIFCDRNRRPCLKRFLSVVAYEVALPETAGRFPELTTLPGDPKQLCENDPLDVLHWTLFKFLI